MRKQLEVLEHHADPLAHPDEVSPGVAEVDPLEDDPAAIHRLQPVRAAEERRLAGAAGTDQADDLAPVHLETDAPEGFEVLVALLHILEDQDGGLALPDAVLANHSTTSKRRWIQSTSFACGYPMAQ